MMSGFKKGELILTSQPYVYVLSNVERGKRCDFCFSSKTTLKRCSQCLFAYFCNKECQTKAWEDHKEECKCIKNVHPKEPTPSLRLLTRLIFKLKKFGYSEPSENAGGYKRTFEMLESHVDEIKADPRTCQQMIAFLGTLKDYIDIANIPPASEFTEIFGKMVINTFSISDLEFQSIGSGLYLGASIFDHSCEPNAEVVFNGTTLTVRAVCDIPHRDLRNVYISYVDQMQFTQDRRQQLQEQYYFLCQCIRCSSLELENIMGRCIVNDDESRIIEENAKKEVAKIKEMKKQSSHPSLIYEASLKGLSKIEGILDNMHFYQVKFIEYGFDACIRLNLWGEALSMGLELVKPYKLFYGGYHPNYGVLLLKIGKIQLLLNQISEAKDTLNKAEEAIKVSHGTNHLLYAELRTQQECCHRLSMEES